MGEGRNRCGQKIISGVVNAIAETLPKRKFFKEAITATIKEE